MFGEDHIRDLIGRMEGARSRGFRVTPATAKLVIDALRFYLAKQGWLTILPNDFPKPFHPWPKRDPGPPPTIGHVKDQGIMSFHIHCRTPKCSQRKLFTFDELGLPDDMVFVHIPHNRRFRCGACGSTDVEVVAHNTQGVPGAMSGGHKLSIYSPHNPDRVPAPPPPRANG